MRLRANTQKSVEQICDKICGEFFKFYISSGDLYVDRLSLV